jgi:flagellar biosynthesis anti-sigma factor FlgM
MSDISPIGSPSATSGARAHRHQSITTPAATSTRGGDKVELSNTAQLLSKLAALPDIRQDLVDRVKAQIANNTYETPEKIDAAITGLGEDLKA